MEKVIRDGKVAVLYSPGFGAGWSTWGRDHRDTLLFHPKLVEMVEAGKTSEIDEALLESIGVPDEFYCGGAWSLRIEWLPVGTKFYVRVSDGFEEIIYAKEDFITA